MQHCLSRQRGLQACSRPQPSQAQAPCSHILLWPAQRMRLLRRTAAPSSLLCQHRHQQQPINSTSRAGQRRRAPPALRVTALEPAPEAPDTPDEDEEPTTYIEDLQTCFNIPGFVEVYEGEGGQPLVFLMHPNGHSLEIYLQGATITRWLKPDGKSIIFTRPDAVFEPGVPINSGVPIAFPQWREGQLPENGFADKLMWDIVATNLGFEFMNLLEPPDLSKYQPVDLAGDIVQDEDGEWVAAEEPEELEGGEEVEGPDAADADGVEADAEEAGTQQQEQQQQQQEPQQEQQQEQQEQQEGEEDANEPSTSGRQGPEISDEYIEQFVEGLVGDPSPFVILRLADNAETRALWPHSFELLLKISLQEIDEYPDPKADLPKGIQPFQSEGDLAQAAAVGANYNTTEYDIELDEEGNEPDAEEPEEGALNLRKKAMDAEDMPDVDEPFPMQVKMEFCLQHTGEPGEPPFDFQLAALPHFATLDQSRYGRFVRCLGLGGKQAFDYSHDPRYARLSAMEDDYLTYGDRRIETAVINAHDADVRICPGDRTHVQLLSRKGFKDAIAYHPGPYPPPGQEAFSPFYAVLGPARVALPKRMKPGEEWRGEFVMRHHNRYWDAPLFDRRGLQPMPPVQAAVDEGEAADDEYEDEGEGGEGEDDWEADYATDSDDEDFDIGPGM